MSRIYKDKKWAEVFGKGKKITKVKGGWKVG